MSLKIFLVGGDLSFVNQDYKILKEKHKVTFFKIKSYFSIFFAIPALIKGIMENDIIYVWFGSILTAFLVFISHLFNKKIIVVAGGYDVANVSSINYGAMSHPIKKYFQKYLFNNADLVLPVSKCSKKELLKETKPRGVKLIYNGVNIDKFSMDKTTKKKQVITVVNKLTWKVMHKKGIETFVLSANKLPDIPFYIIGSVTPRVKRHLKKIMSKNLHFSGYMNYKSLLRVYKSSKVYAQLSKHESFGVALAEAMLCECVPVVANTSALPEVVGKTGYYVEYGNVEDTVSKIQNALHSKKGKKARNRIVKSYSFKKRKKELSNVLKSFEKDFK